MITQKEIRHVIAENIRQQIQKLGVSVEQVAQSAGFSKDHLYKILREEVGISDDKLGGLAKALDIGVAELYAEPKPKPKNGR